MTDPGAAPFTAEPEGTGPLTGTLVVDLTTQLPGPYATMLLRALGARVVKVEPPGGDAARGIDPAMFARVNAGKELIELDLKSGDGREVVHQLARHADVFIEGFRPGVVSRLGADYTTLSRLNPDLIYCSLSGFGQAGPLADLPSHDVNLLALAGGISRAADYRHVTIPSVDLAAGSSAALAIVAALLPEPRQTAYLDMSLLDSAVVWSEVKRTNHGEELEPSYGVFVTSDDERIAISVMEDEAWDRLCEALDWTEWRHDPVLRRYSVRRSRSEEISRQLDEAVRQQPLARWLETADRHQLPITAVLDPQDAHSHPQIRRRSLTESGLLQAPLPEALRVPVTTPAGEPDAHGPALRREFTERRVSRSAPHGMTRPDGRAGR